VVVERTALLVMDVQTAIVAGAPSSMLRAVSVALDGAHNAGIPVVYIQVLLRPGRAGVSPRNKKLTGLHEMLTEGAPGLDILPAVAPLPDDCCLPTLWTDIQTRRESPWGQWDRWNQWDTCPEATHDWDTCPGATGTELPSPGPVVGHMSRGQSETEQPS
jgi:hypothetical protein